MSSVRARLLAFAPLVVLTLLTAAAAVVGYRTSDDSPGPGGAAATPSATTPSGTPATPTAAPTEAGPFLPVPPVKAVVPVVAPVTVTEARKEWDRAIGKLVHAASGKYSWAVYYDADPDPFQRETGSFDLDPFQTRFDRTVPGRNGKKLVVHVRRIAETTYMQFDDWGQWTGCWLRVTNDQIERATGADLSESVPLPVSVLAIADAQVVRPTGFWFGPPFREYGATVNAAEALAFLGFTGRIVTKQVDRLTKIRVPFTISLDAAGRIHGGGVHGSQVAAVMARTAPKLLEDVVEGLPHFRAAFAVKGLGSPVSVPAPLPGSILPFNAGRGDTCDSQGPRA